MTTRRNRAAAGYQGQGNPQGTPGTGTETRPCIDGDRLISLSLSNHILPQRQNARFRPSVTFASRPSRLSLSL